MFHFNSSMNKMFQDFQLGLFTYILFSSVFCSIHITNSIFISILSTIYFRVSIGELKLCDESERKVSAETRWIFLCAWEAGQSENLLALRWVYITIEMPCTYSHNGQFRVATNATQSRAMQCKEKNCCWWYEVVVLVTQFDTEQRTDPLVGLDADRSVW